MTIGRPREFDPDEALDAAVQVFWSKGYEATSLQNLLQATDLSKSSLYQVFGSKQQLFGRCIDRYCDALTAELQRRLERAPSGRQFLEALFFGFADHVGARDARRGCLLMNTACEFGQRNPDVADRLGNGMGRLSKVFLAAVKRARQEGGIPAEKDPEALAVYLVSSMSGLRTMIKAGSSRQCARDIVRLILSALD